ncbi:LacI family transcriptional regulator, partial [Amylibacter sp.]|nr:LacI family transcriptional regulator [Amylibacter sp.]
MKELSKAIGISRPTLARFFEDESKVLPSTSKKLKI